MIGAVVPVKMLHASKSRMLPALDRAAVEWLTIAMLGDVLESLLQVRGLDRIAVATPDRVRRVRARCRTRVFATRGTMRAGIIRPPPPARAPSRAGRR